MGVVLQTFLFLYPTGHSSEMLCDLVRFPLILDLQEKRQNNVFGFYYCVIIEKLNLSITLIYIQIWNIEKFLGGHLTYVTYSFEKKFGWPHFHELFKWGVLLNQILEILSFKTTMPIRIKFCVDCPSMS